jgi:hypothetical protein
VGHVAVGSLAGDTRNLYEGSLDELQAQFRSLAARIGAQASSTHLLTYCSAARSGARTVTLRPVRSRGGSDADSTFIEFSFSATGFGGGCAEYLSSVCDGRECGGFNCGACDDATEVCETASGVCQAR